MFLIVEGDQRVIRLHRVSSPVVGWTRPARLPAHAVWSLDRGAVNDQNVNESEKRRLISYGLKVFV